MNNNGQKQKFLVSIIVILLVANIGLLAFLFWPEKKHAGRSESRDLISYSLEKKVGFTDEQMAEYRKLREGYVQKMKPLFEELRRVRQELFDLLHTGAADSTIQTAATAVSEKQKAIDLQVFDHLGAVRSMCTPAQYASFDSLTEKLVYKMSIPYKTKAKTSRDSTGRK